MIMAARKFSFIVGAMLAMASPSAFSYGPKSELDKATDYVDRYLQQNNDSQGQQAQLTKLLKGLAGLELSVYFKTDSAQLDKHARHQIYQIAKTLWVYPDPTIRLRLDAFTDKRGSKEYNLKLAQKRLDAVQQVFQNALGKHYDKNRFYTGIQGEKRAIYDRADEEGMSLDRRVTITLFVQN